MKRIFLAALLVCGGLSSFAQCDKKVILSASKTEYLNTSGGVEHQSDETTTVEITKDNIVIAPSSAPAPMNGTITSQTCNWSVPYKEGKSVIKAKLSDGGNILNLTLTIEGKDGKVNILAIIDEMPDRQIRVPVDSFKEKV